MHQKKAKFLHQLTFKQFIFQVNCFLIEEETELTLIDAANPGSSQRILDTAKQIGKPITKLIFTHCHTDHIGSLDELKEALPNTAVMFPKRELKILEGNTEHEDGEPPSPIRRVSYPKNLKTKPDKLLVDNDRIGPLLAITSPGHTAGSMSFFDTRDGALIVGDAFQTLGGVAVSGKFKARYPFPALANWNKQASLASAQKLRKLSPTLLAVGHGDALHQPLVEMDDAITQAQKWALR
ncbi:MBL fold metallo-hydrolase [Camelliibacillus cellulosilyticus]|uniref:MBL fold metallo-hydrolase n=1 Tax=Camelliibacillus cellulosilyticus TaxID=2174486 RepID=A0ABV9GR95_9BACL